MLIVGRSLKPMSEEAIKAVVEAWFGDDPTMFDACTDEPEVAWQAILQILQRDLTDDQKASLAAGPLEMLLSYHGAAFIDRVEEQAQRNPRLNHLLGGVWRTDMAQDVWDRVERVRREVW
jgi:hypothetical protein